MYSFDIYDTLFTRTVFKPKDIFWLMEKKIVAERSKWGVCDFFAYNFAYLRINAEILARAYSTKEITLGEIYRVLEHNQGITTSISRYLQEMEMLTEIENTIPIAEVVGRVLDLKKKGERVILISDMYLPHCYFVELFRRFETKLIDIPLYLSCEMGVTKASGEIFPRIKDIEKIEYKNWIHIGDNIRSDVNIPELFGISTRRYVKNRYNSISELRCEKRENREFAAFVNEHIQHYVSEKRENAFQVGYRIGGAVIFSYVMWILYQAKMRSIKHLYFVSRDGYILKKVADILIKHKRQFKEIKTHYIYGSRKAWRIKDEYSKELLVRYLNQELAINDEYALVDTHGTGNSTDSLGKILGKKVSVFYYHLIENAEGKDIEAFSYSGYSANGFIEVLCRAPHGAVLGYAEDGSQIVPIFAKMDMTSWENAHLDSYLEGVVKICEDLAVVRENSLNAMSIYSVAENLLRVCAEHPNKMVADFIGDIPHDLNNVTENSVFAPSLEKKQLETIFYRPNGVPLEQIYAGFDLEYSFKRLSESNRKLLQDLEMHIISDPESKKNASTRVVIYGYGKYGKELLRRLKGTSIIYVVAVVDVSFQAQMENVSLLKAPKWLRDNLDLYDCIVISLQDKCVCAEISGMLMAAGIESSRIMSREAFLERFFFE